MKRYTVRSTFRDAKGKDLFHRKTFDGMAEDAKCALIEAHKEMQRLGAEDVRVDSISSMVKGPNEEISTTDYLDELGRGMSGAGLMNEVAPEDLEPRRGPGGVMIGNPTEEGSIYRDIFANPRAQEEEPTPEMIAAYPDLAKRSREIREEGCTAPGGVVPEADTFRGSDGRDTTKVPGSMGEGVDAQRDHARATGGPINAPAPGWNDPSSNPLADIIAGRRRIEEESHGSPAWLTPGEYVVPYEAFPLIPKRTVGDIIKESWREGEPTLRDMRAIREFGSPLTKAQESMLHAMSESAKDYWDQYQLGRWAAEKETDNE